MRLLISVSASCERDAAPLPQAEQLQYVGVAMIRSGRIDNLHAFEIHAEFVGPGLNFGGIAEQDGMPDFLFDQHAAGAQDFFVVALGKDHLFRIGLRFVNHGA